MEKKLKIGVIGLSCRGLSMLSVILEMPDIDVVAVCDKYQDRMETGAAKVAEKRGETPFATQNYFDLMKMDEIEAIMIFTSWEYHINIACDAMKAGKYVAVEVGGAYSVEDCWKLVRTYEETNVPCMLLENCCYGRNELMVLNMVKQGLFGEIVHCQGGYRHDLRQEVAFGRENRHYRLDNYLNRNCENYPTHELGPIAKILDINHGNRMLTLTSVASKARGLHEYILKEKGADDPLANANFAQGDVITTIIKCAQGETIVLFLDTTLPRPYSRGFHIQGTKGMFTEDNQSIYIDELHSQEHGAWKNQWGNAANFKEEYDHPLWKDYNPEGKGHGGIDYLVMREFFESAINKTQTPIDAYDTAAWMCVSALSEQSISTGQTVSFPDFTNGKWLVK